MPADLLPPGTSVQETPRGPRAVQQPRLHRAYGTPEAVVADPLPKGQAALEMPLRPRAALQPTFWRAYGTPTAFVADPLPIGTRLLPDPVRRLPGLDAQAFDTVAYLPVAPFPPVDLTPRWAKRGLDDSRVTGTQGRLPTIPVVLPDLPPGREQSWPVPAGPQPRDTRFTREGTPLPNEIPPPAIVPETPSFGGGGGGGGRIHYWAKHHRKHAPDRHLAKLLDDVVAETLYRDLKAEDDKQARAAGAAVKPHSADKRYAAPPPEAVNWDALTRDVEAIAALLKLYREREQQRQIDDEDDEWLLMED